MTLRESGPRKTSKIDAFWNEHPDAQAKLFVLHATNHRRAEASPMNLGPFTQAMGGKLYTFALTGKVNSTGWPSSGEPVGDSACEAVFSHLLSLLEQRNVKTWSYDDFAWLRTSLRRMDPKGGFSCMFSDGTYLFCYLGRTDENVLSFSQAAGNGSRFGDQDFEFTVPAEASKSHVGILVASRSTDDGPGWAPFEAEELIVYTGGETVFFNTKRTNPGPDAAMVERIASLLNEGKPLSVQRIASTIGRSRSQASLGVLALLETGRAVQSNRRHGFLGPRTKFKFVYSNTKRPR